MLRPVHSRIWCFQGATLLRKDLTSAKSSFELEQCLKHPNNILNYNLCHWLFCQCCQTHLLPRYEHELAFQLFSSSKIAAHYVLSKPVRPPTHLFSFAHLQVLMCKTGMQVITNWGCQCVEQSAIFCPFSKLDMFVIITFVCKHLLAYNQCAQ